MPQEQIARSVQDTWDRRHWNNPYTTNAERRPSGQEPERMYRPQRERTREEIIYGNSIPTPEEIDRVLGLSQVSSPTANEIKEKEEEKKFKKRKRNGLDLDYRHRYGDEWDIIKAKFTKTKRELEDEKFRLILSTRQLGDKIHYVCSEIPRHEKFTLGNEIRQCSYTLLRLSVAIKKKYYRKNMLETMDIELEVLREFLRRGNRSYPKWITDERLDGLLEACNVIGRIIHGLLCTAVV